MLGLFLAFTFAVTFVLIAATVARRLLLAYDIVPRIAAVDPSQTRVPCERNGLAAQLLLVGLQLRQRPAVPSMQYGP